MAAKTQWHLRERVESNPIVFFGAPLPPHEQLQIDVTATALIGHASVQYILAKQPGIVT